VEVAVQRASATARRAFGVIHDSSYFAFTRAASSIALAAFAIPSPW
jgi:hypothetical protein